MATQPAEQNADDDEDDDADDGDGRVLAAQIGLRALLDRGRDLLHAGIAGVGGQHVANGPRTVHERQ